MDKFVVKTRSASSQETKRSHLPANILAKDRARKYSEGTFHVDNGLLFNPFVGSFLGNNLFPANPVYKSG